MVALPKPGGRGSGPLLAPPAAGAAEMDSCMFIGSLAGGAIEEGTGIHGVGCVQQGLSQLAGATSGVVEGSHFGVELDVAASRSV